MILDQLFTADSLAESVPGQTRTPYDIGGADAWYHRGSHPEQFDNDEDRAEYLRGYQDEGVTGRHQGKQYDLDETNSLTTRAADPRIQEIGRRMIELNQLYAQAQRMKDDTLVNKIKQALSRLAAEKLRLQGTAPADMAEGLDTGDDNREYHDDKAEWKQAVTQAGGGVWATSAAGGKYLARGWDDQVFGEFDPATGRGWIVRDFAKQGMSEDSLNEISKETAASYFDKLLDRSIAMTDQRKDAKKAGDLNTVKSLDAKFKKMKSGMTGALKRIKGVAEDSVDSTIDILKGKITQDGQQVGTVMQTLKHGYHPIYLLKLNNGFSREFEMDTPDLKNTLIKITQRALSARPGQLDQEDRLAQAQRTLDLYRDSYTPDQIRRLELEIEQLKARLAPKQDVAEGLGQPLMRGAPKHLDLSKAPTVMSNHLFDKIYTDNNGPAFEVDTKFSLKKNPRFKNSVILVGDKSSRRHPTWGQPWFYQGAGSREEAQELKQMAQELNLLVKMNGGMPLVQRKKLSPSAQLRKDQADWRADDRGDPDLRETQQDVAETNVSKYADMGATNSTTHFIKNITTGKIVSPHRSRQDAEDALVATMRDSDDEFKIVRARKEGTAEAPGTSPSRRRRALDTAAAQKRGEPTPDQLDAKLYQDWYQRLQKKKSDVAETTGDVKFDKMLKGITAKKAVAKQQKADTQQQARDAFGGMFGGGNPADKLGLGKKDVSEAQPTRRTMPWSVWNAKSADDQRFIRSQYPDLVITDRPRPKSPAAPKKEKIDYAEIARKIQEIVGNTFPDGDPIDWLIPYMRRRWGQEYNIGQHLDRAARRHLGARDYTDYLAQMWDQVADDDLMPDHVTHDNNPWRAREGMAEGNGTYVKHEKPGSWRRAGYERGTFWAQHSGTRETKGFTDRATRDQWIRDQNKPGVEEGRWFRTSYGWAGGRNEKTGKMYKHPELYKKAQDKRDKRDAESGAVDKPEKDKPINELSATTLANYTARARKQSAELAPHADTGEYRDMASNIINKRKRGQAQAAIKSQGRHGVVAATHEPLPESDLERFHKSLGQQVRDRVAQTQADVAITRAKDPGTWQWNKGDQVYSKKTGKVYTILGQTMNPKFGAMYWYQRGREGRNGFERGQFIASLAHETLTKVNEDALSESEQYLVLYIDGRAVAKYKETHQARADLERLQSKFPQKNIELKTEMLEAAVAEGLRDPADNPCWKGYYPVGTKKKNGRTVPNCVPKK